MKKALSVFLSIALLLMLLPLGSVTATSVTSGDFEYFVSSNKATISDYFGSGGEVTIPATIDGYAVTAIGNYAFYYCDTITSVTIPKGVTTIGDDAFSHCSALTGITIPEGVTEIRPSAFSSCVNLASITIPKGMTRIGYYAFFGCVGLTSVVIPDSVTYMGWGVFEDCSNLASVTIGSGLTYIGSSTFCRCTNLTGITIPSSVTEIKWAAFEDCPNLASITIGSGVTEIGKEVFSGCNNLSHVFYTGTAQNWDCITIGEENDRLTSATRHTDVTPGNHVTVTVNKQPTCTQGGKETHFCDICGKTFANVYPSALGHTYESHACIRCGRLDYESAHPYESDCDETWTIEKPGATSVSVTFSNDTETEELDSGNVLCDYIEIYGKNDTLIGQYYGKQLAGKTVTVPGDTVKIRLVSDYSLQYYGFAVTSITAVYGEQPTLLGDVNGDGDVTGADVVLLRRAVAELATLDEAVKSVADVNGDGDITGADVVLLRRFVAELVASLG